MSVIPMVAKGKTSFIYNKSNLWVVKEPKENLYIKKVPFSDSQGQRLRNRVSVTDVGTKFATQTECVINSSQALHSRNFNSNSNSSHNVGTHSPDKQAEKLTDETESKQYGNLNMALSTKPVSMQNGKVLQKRQKSVVSCKKIRSSNEIRKHHDTSESSSITLSKVHFRIGIQSGSLPHQPSRRKFNDRALKNVDRSNSPDRTDTHHGNKSEPPMIPPHKLHQSKDDYIKHVKKIFLSERQSGSIKVEGTVVPCAPPATPTPEQLLQYEYVPSLKDIRAQRAVRQRLQIIEKKEQKRRDKQKEEQMKLDKQLMKQKEIELKKKQRQEIYALNAVMTALENKKFEEFCKAKGISL